MNKQSRLSKPSPPCRYTLASLRVLDLLTHSPPHYELTCSHNHLLGGTWLHHTLASLQVHTHFLASTILAHTLVSLQLQTLLLLSTWLADILVPLRVLIWSNIRLVAGNWLDSHSPPCEYLTRLHTSSASNWLVINLASLHELDLLTHSPPCG